MSRVIEFNMALDNAPEKERTWEYKALSLKISKKAIAKGKRPVFIVVEKGVGITQMSVEQDASGTRFILADRTEFSQADCQRAIGIIGSKMFSIMHGNGVIDKVS